MCTFTDIEYDGRKKTTKRELFLQEMDRNVPWDELEKIIKPYYYNNRRGRPAWKLNTMLRMYMLQVWFSLSDEGLEDNIYDSYAMKHFLNIDFMDGSVPDATTLLKFSSLT